MNGKKDTKKSANREKAIRWALEDDPKVMSNSALLGILKDQGKCSVQKNHLAVERPSLISIDNLVSPLVSPKSKIPKKSPIETQAPGCLNQNPSPCFGRLPNNGESSYRKPKELQETIKQPFETEEALLPNPTDRLSQRIPLETSFGNSSSINPEPLPSSFLSMTSSQNRKRNSKSPSNFP